MTKPRLAQGKGGRHYVWPPNTDTPELYVPSVTNILNELAKPALQFWYAKVVAEYAVEHRDAWADLPAKDAVDLVKGAPRRHTAGRIAIGTAVHAAVEHHMLKGGGVVDLDDAELLPYVSAAIQFLDDFQVDPVHIERSVFNRTFQYAGTGDLFATVVPPDSDEDGRVMAIIDWKSKETGKSLYPDVALQLGALANGEFLAGDQDDELEVPDCQLGLAVALYDDATYKAYPVDLATYGERIFKTFGALRTLHAWKSNFEGLVMGAPIEGSAA